MLPTPAGRDETVSGGLPADATAAFVGFNVNASTLGVAELLGTWNRWRGILSHRRVTAGRTVPAVTVRAPPPAR